MDRRKLLLVIAIAFALGEADPLGWLYWRAAESYLARGKSAALAAPSPFESIPPDRWVAESAHAFVVDDIDPQAPVHVLVVAKTRVPSLLDAPPELLAEMLALARDTARARGVAENGFRVVINTNPLGAQTVYHLHMHVLGGRQMRWPPG